MAEQHLHSFRTLASDPDRPLYLFGAGMGGQCAWKELRTRGVTHIAGFLDNAPERHGGIYGGLPILDPGLPAWRRGNPLVILSPIDSRYVLAMKGQCETLGVECIGYSELVANSYGWAMPDFWADGESTETFQSVLRVFKTHDWSGLPPPVPDQYFQPFVPSGFYRSFVDGGAYAGDTLDSFRAKFGDAFDDYYAFEPDPRNFAGLETRTGDPRLHLFNIGLSDRGAEMFLDPGVVSSGARVVSEGEGVDALRVDALDAVLAGRKVTCIKMDVEGAEPEALLGAREIIKAQRPALAVCVYHRPDHLWEIPGWIKTFEPSYSLYLRHHSGYDYETVCYAVPKG